MFTLLRHSFELYRLALRLRRHGAIRALSKMPMMPGKIPVALRLTTFFVPRRLQLPKDEGERLAAALATMGPAYIKLGQTLATRPDVVGPDLADGLATLQDKLPQFSGAKARAIVEDALDGKLEDFYSEFDEQAIAAASIAQVHKAVTLDGAEVAVKIVRPDVEKRFNRDIDLFAWVAGVAEIRMKEARRLRLGAVVDTVRKATMNEMDMRVEAAAASELSDNMAGEAGYRVPAVDWARTARNVMTQEWVQGIRFNEKENLKAAGFDMPVLAKRIVQVFLKQAMRDGYFHADLHQGNLIVEEDGTIVAVDFGIMGRLNTSERRYLAEILYGFIQRDYRRVAEVHFDAGYVPMHHNVDEFAQALKAIADPILDLPIEQISAGELLAQLFATTQRFDMKTQPQLILLQRSMVMAEGMALHLYTGSNMWDFAAPVLEDWMRANLSPEMRLADFLRGLPRMIERLPMRIERLIEKLEQQSDREIVPPAPKRYSGLTVVMLTLIGAFTYLGTLAILGG